MQLCYYYFRDFTVRPACKKDYPGVEKLVQTIHLHENLLKDLSQYNKARRDEVGVYCLWVLLEMLLVISFTKTYLYNFDPLKLHFYIVKLGFKGYKLFFLISAQNINWGYLLELPCWGSSNKYPQSMFWAEIWKYQFLFQKLQHWLPWQPDMHKTF